MLTIAIEARAYRYNNAAQLAEDMIQCSDVLYAIRCALPSPQARRSMRDTTA